MVTDNSESKRKFYYLKLCIRQKKGAKVGTRLLIRASKKANMYCYDKTIEEMLLLLEIQFKKWKKLKKKAKKLRQSHLDYLAEVHEKHGREKKASIVKSLKKTKEHRETCQRLRHISGKLEQNLSTTSVRITNKDGSFCWNIK